MKRKMLTILGLLVLVSAPLFANGGIHWWVNGSGTNPSVITLKNDSDIILKKENLVLRFVDDCVIVSCDYVLFNKSNAEKQIDFAFNITDSAYDSLKYYDIFVNDLKVDSELHKDVVYDEENSFSWWELSKVKLSANKKTIISICYRVETANDGTYYRSLEE